MESELKEFFGVPDCYKRAVLEDRDVVNSPSHYTQGEVECIDAIAAAVIGKSGMEAVCTANVIKYLWRYERKGGKQDVEKARWYLDRLLKEVE
jgi:hypothetical protein